MLTKVKKVNKKSQTNCIQE